MKHIRHLLFTLVQIVFITTLANDSSYGRGPQGGALFPIQNEHIQMLEEEVIYNQEKGTFSTEFIFYNTSDKMESVILAFPVMPSESSDYDWMEDERTPEDIIAEIEKELNFRTWIDGKEVKRELWTLDSVDKYEYAFYTPIIMRPKEKIKVLNTFNQGFGYGGSNMGDSWSDIVYVLETGALWKDNIQRATIRFEMEPGTDLHLYNDTVIGKEFMMYAKNYKCMIIDKGWEFSPEPTSIDYENSILVWKFKDFKPDFNIIISERAFNHYLHVFEFPDYLDSLSYLIQNNLEKDFDAYIEKLEKKENKELFRSSKDYCSRFYLQYGKDIQLEKNIDYDMLKHKTRHVVNALAAIQGYRFKNEKWRRVFELFDWYEPITDTPYYTPEQRKLLDEILLFENEMQASSKINKELDIEEIERPTAPISQNQIKTVREPYDKNTQKNNTLITFCIVVTLAVLITLFIGIKKYRSNSRKRK